MTLYLYGSSYGWSSLIHVYSVDYWFDISIFWIIGVISYVFLNVIWFSLVWPPTASSVGISVEVDRSLSWRIPYCEYLFRHTVLHEVSGFSTPEAIISSLILTRVSFFLPFLKELLYHYGKDFQLSCYFCFSIITGFWLVIINPASYRFLCL